MKCWVHPRDMAGVYRYLIDHSAMSYHFEEEWKRSEKAWAHPHKLSRETNHRDCSGLLRFLTPEHQILFKLRFAS